MGELPGVVHSVDYKYMCSDPGQALIKQAIKEHNLDGVVVGACSPHMHEKTFRKAAASAGLNPYLCEMANIRSTARGFTKTGQKRPRRPKVLCGS